MMDSRAGLGVRLWNVRISCTNNPEIYNPAVNNMESSGVVKHENSIASATTSASFSSMKYTATSTAESSEASECFTYQSTRNNPAAIAAVFTVSVSTSPPNFPIRNSHRLPALATKAKIAPSSIPFYTSPTPTHLAIHHPTPDTPTNP